MTHDELVRVIEGALCESAIYVQGRAVICDDLCTKPRNCGPCSIPAKAQSIAAAIERQGEGAGQTCAWCDGTAIGTATLYPHGAVTYCREHEQFCRDAGAQNMQPIQQPPAPADDEAAVEACMEALCADCNLRGATCERSRNEPDLGDPYTCYHDNLDSIRRAIAALRGIGWGPAR